jgi:predicted  nucleic acid-binding Zn-ribbon protein
MASQTELEKNDMHQKLKRSEASQAHLSSMLSAEKQAHAAAVASLQQIQQGHSQQIKETKDQVKTALQTPLL